MSVLTDSSLSCHGNTKKLKTCRVCGDRAFGFNFNAVTCESCKAFFRRSAFKTYKSRCEGNCQVTTESRSYCKHCRLKKCLLVGMKKELISCSSSNKCPHLSPKISSTQYREHELKFTEEECILFSELEEAHKLAFASSACDVAQYGNSTEDPGPTEFLNMANSTVHKVIKMAKNLERFKSLLQEDQIALLKGGIIEVLIFKSSTNYDPSANMWCVETMDSGRHCVKMDNYGSAMLSTQIYQDFMKFMRQVTLVLCKDPILISFLMVLSLFMPDRPGVSNQRRIQDTQEVYSALLTKYVRMRVTERNVLARMIMLLVNVRDVNQMHTSIIQKGADCSQIDPLLVEVFNLK